MEIDFCKHFVKGQQTRVRFDPTIHYTKVVLQYIISDIWGLLTINMGEITILFSLLMSTHGKYRFIL